MDSILQEDKTRCFLCGKRNEPLDKHHVFGGPLRNASERYGMTVYLCHNSCHIFGQNSIHVNHEVDMAVKRYAQLVARDEYGWDNDSFRKYFRKNYLEDDNEHD